MANSCYGKEVDTAAFPNQIVYLCAECVQKLIYAAVMIEKPSIPASAIIKVDAPPSPLLLHPFLLIPV